MDIMNQKKIQNHVKHVTIDVLFVKTVHNILVQNVLKTITYLEHHVSHVPNVEKMKDTIVMQIQTNVENVIHNVILVKNKPTTV